MIAQAQMMAFIKLSGLPEMPRTEAERIITAALAIEDTKEFRIKHQPLLNGEIHPYAVTFARVALASQDASPGLVNACSAADCAELALWQDAEDSFWCD